MKENPLELELQEMGDMKSPGWEAGGGRTIFTLTYSIIVTIAT